MRGHPFKKHGPFLLNSRFFQIPVVLFILVILPFIVSSCSEEQEPISPQTRILEGVQPVSTYSFSQDDKVIDFGDQPYWIPSSIVTEFMMRDPTLKQELQKHGFTLQNHHFLKGADLNYFFAKGDLEVGVAGDMPALTISSSEDVSLLSVFKGSVSIVSQNIREISHLKGKKIGYAFGSNAHFFLLNTLKMHQLDISDIELVEMDIITMASALDNSEIDAYSTWEFTPSTTMKIVQDKITTHKGTSYGFLYIRNAFLKENAEIVYLLLASQIRAVNWLRADDKNVKIMSYWLYNELNDWGQKTTPLSLARIINHVKEAIAFIQLDGYPQIPPAIISQKGVLNQELLFLIEHGLLPKNLKFNDIKRSINTQPLEHVFSHPSRYHIFKNVTLPQVN